MFFDSSTIAIFNQNFTIFELCKKIISVTIK